MTARLDRAARESALAEMGAGGLDVLVIGGGVVGAGTALDLVSRGLSVGLVEQDDWASGTSSRSSKLIHGGLRYLEMLQFGLVREALRERTLLLDRLAPHLVRRVPFLYPLHHHAVERAYVGAGLLLYDGLARIPGQPRALPAHRHLYRRSVHRVAPGLRTETVTGAVQYYDAQVDDARFVLTLVRTAAAYGARVASRARATTLISSGDRVVGARVHDHMLGVDHEIRAKVIVSAAGVWTPELLDRLGADGEQAVTVRASKGVHLVVPRDRIRSSTGVITRTATSVLFLVPWGRHWLVGTTDTAWELDRDRPLASARDVDYLLAEANRHLITPLTRADVVGCFAGLRPLVSVPPRRADRRASRRSRRLADREQTARIAREHTVRIPVPGLVVVAGGTYTTYRVMAADAADAAARSLGGLVENSVTHRLPLLGAEGYHARWNQRHLLARQAGLHVARVEHLLNRYGSLADELLAAIAERPELGAPLPGAEDYLAAEVLYAVTHEGAMDLTDVLARRTRIAFETPDRGGACAAQVAQLAAPVWNWDDGRLAAEVDGYRRRVEAERAAEGQPDDHAAVAVLRAAESTPVIPQATP